MIAIADSGSTRTEWIFTGNGKTTQHETPGLNPLHLSEAELRARIREAVALIEADRERQGVPPAARPGRCPGALYFWGAGCIPSECRKTERLLAEAFRAGRVEAESDLSGAARALCGHTPGIACILGTGSNSCYYDGAAIREHIPPLGFILGDEGSGAALGKKLLGDLLKGRLAPELRTAFFEKYRLTEAQMLQSVYREPMPSRFLAGFAPFLRENIGHPEIANLVSASFAEFFERNVLRYSGAKTLPIAFIGSIAFHFASQLRQVAERYGVRIGKIEASPLEGLLAYHTENRK